MPSVIYRDPKIKINAVVYKDTTVRVKKLKVGTPVKRVTAGSFDISNLGGTDITGKTSGSILAYQALGGKWETTNFATGNNISIAFDSAANTFTFGTNAALTNVTSLDATTTSTVRGILSASGDLAYNSSTGQFSIDVENVYTKANFDSDLGLANTGQLPEGSNLYHTTARARSAVSVTDAGGDGSLSYNTSTGVITYTGASAAEVRTHLTANKGLSVSNGEFNIDSANVRGMFSASGDLSYNSGTGQFSFDVENVYTKANFDSDLGLANTGQLPEGSNLYYTDARVDARITTASVTATGALMDSELTDLSGVKGVTISTLQPKPSEGAFVDGDKTKLDAIESGATADQTDAEIKTAYENNSDTNAFTDAEKTKLTNIEASADVTDTANVTSAGALMDSELTDLAGVKGVTISTLQVKPTEGAFVDGDKTKLDAIEASADVTDTANVTAAGALMDSELTDLAGVKGVTISTLQVKPSEGAFANGDKTKLDGIEASADVTDTANVTSAGALMDSELASIADVKALDQSVVSGATPTFTTTNFTDATDKRFMTDAQESKLDGIEASATADQTDAEIRAAVEAATDSNVFTDADHTKLNAIEASADVTDTANVTAAGALMDSEVDADIKTLSLPANTTISAFGKTLVDDADAATARTTLGVDASGTDNSTDVTLAGSLDYITISGQEITRNAINLSTDVTGTLPVGNMAATALTTVQTAANESAHLALTAQEGDVVVRSDQNKTYMHNGGTAGTMDDYTLLATPTDAVTSVNGNTGVVTVTENVTTNLGITGTTGARTITSSDGTDAVIPVATDSVSGVMSAADHTKLTGIETSADVTDTANVTAAGALMDSELASIADVKALDQSVISGASPTFGTANMSDATNKRFMTDAQETKLDSVESSADVTDTANVTAAGALMDSELTDLAGVKGVTISTLQVKPSEGAFANGDKTKLDGIEASADVTDTANVTAAGALMDSELTDLAGVKGVTISTLQVKPSEGAFVDGDKTKLDAIEASADVTDTANVTAAGALMDSELTDLAGVKGVTISTLQVKPSEGAFANGDKTKLDAIEASADVTDTANVTSAGALMDSELASIADVKALDQSVVSGSSPNFATTNMTDASNKRFMTDAQETKLDSVESSADVTDTANVTSAGAVMDSELTSIADVKALDQSVVSGASPTFATTNMTDATNKRFMSDAQETKLDSVESSATADQTAAEILTAVKTVDGASSGLDADLLDGVQGASYLRSDTNDTFTGNLTVAGKIGLGDADTVADHELHIQSASPTIRLEDTDGNQRFDITQSAGSTNIDYETDMLFKKSDGTEIVRFDGAGVDVTGEVTITSHLDMPDDAKIKLGTSDDLEIFHDGSNSYVSDTGTGDIIIKGQYVRLQDEVGTNLLTADGNDAVSLYFGGAAKLATTTSGINVTGSITGDALTVDTTASNGVTINGHDNATTTYPLKVSNAAGSGNLELGTYGINNNIDLKLQRGGSTKLTVTSSGVDVTGTVEFNGLSGTGAVTVTDILDEDDMSTNSATMLATQQSIKAYVDANAGSMSNAQVRAAVEAATDSNVFTDADHTKLNGIEASATADQTAAQILTAIKTVDGSGSGLDADTVDGIGSGSFLRSDADDAVNAYTTQITFPSNTTGATASGDQSSLQVKQATANSDAFMTFHVEGDFAAYFGIDGTTNDLFVGGWSMGANKYKIWHQNNDGSGSGLDADTLDGVQGSSYLRSDADDTYTGALTVTGSIALSSHLDMPDAAQIKIGTGDDLLIYQDGAASIVKHNTSGQLFFMGDDIRFVNQANNNAIMYLVGDVVQFYGNSTRPDGTHSYFGTGNDLDMYHDGSNSWIRDIGTGDLFLDTNSGVHLYANGSENMLYAVPNGAVTLYYDNSAKLATTTSGINVTGTGTFDSNVEIQASSGYGYMEMGGPSGAFIDLKKPFSDDYDFRIRYDDNAKLETTGNYVQVSTASGYVQIGPQNTSYSHFSTDRAKFYFNKQINVDSGIIASHNEDMQLLPGASTQSAYIKLVNGASTTNGSYHYFVDDNADQSTYAHTMNSNQSGSQTTTADRLHTNLFVDTNVTATGGGTDHEHRPIGIYNDMDITGSNTDPDLIWGVYNYITLSQTGTGQTASAYADYNQTYLNHESSSQLVQSSYGTFSRIYHANAAGTTTNSYAAYNHNYFHSSANADTSASYGTYSEVEANRAITYPNFIANLAVIDRNNGTISNGYMYKADYQGTLPTNAWGVYCEGDKHYLQGRVGINTTSPSSSYALDVNGDIVCDKIRIEGNGDASLSSTAHGLQVGTTGGANIAIDGNEILARSNGAASSLILQNDGGNISACAGGGTVTFGGALSVPSQILHTGDSNTYMQFHAADQWRVVAGGNERLEVRSDGVLVSTALTATGDVIAFGSSDKRLKDDITPIPDAMEKIKKLSGNTFKWNDKQETYEVGSQDVGVVAQEVEDVLPEVVVTREDGYKAVKYEKMVALLIEGMKEQQEEIDKLKKQIEDMK